MQWFFFWGGVPLGIECPPITWNYISRGDLAIANHHGNSMSNVTRKYISWRRDALAKPSGKKGKTIWSGTSEDRISWQTRKELTRGGGGAAQVCKVGIAERIILLNFYRSHQTDKHKFVHIQLGQANESSERKRGAEGFCQRAWCRPNGQDKMRHLSSSCDRGKLERLQKRRT